jgi:hypothetical protein
MLNSVNLKISNKQIYLSILGITLVIIILSTLFNKFGLIFITIGLVTLIFLLNFSFKRHIKYKSYLLTMDVYPSELGDIIELGIIGVRSGATASYLKIYQLKFNCLLDFERTYYVIECINPLHTIEKLNIFENQYFNHYDKALSAIKLLKNTIKLDIKNNLLTLRTTELSKINIAQTIKKHSGYFGIFKPTNSYR